MAFRPERKLIYLFNDSYIEKKYGTRESSIKEIDSPILRGQEDYGPISPK